MRLDGPSKLPSTAWNIALDTCVENGELEKACFVWFTIKGQIHGVLRSPHKEEQQKGTGKKSKEKLKHRKRKEKKKNRQDKNRRQGRPPSFSFHTVYSACRWSLVLAKVSSMPAVIGQDVGQAHEGRRSALVHALAWSCAYICTECSKNVHDALTSTDISRFKLQ